MQAMVNSSLNSYADTLLAKLCLMPAITVEVLPKFWMWYAWVIDVMFFGGIWIKRRELELNGKEEMERAPQLPQLLPNKLQISYFFAVPHVLPLFSLPIMINGYAAFFGVQNGRTVALVAF